MLFIVIIIMILPITRYYTHTTCEFMCIFIKATGYVMLIWRQAIKKEGEGTWQDYPMLKGRFLCLFF